jgi:signal peptidase II
VSAPGTLDRPAAADGGVARALPFVVVGGIVAVDQVTKVWAERALQPLHTPHDVIGHFLRFTLTYNPGAAFGMHLGEWSRGIFMLLTLTILGFLYRLYRGTPAADRGLRLAVLLVMGGAIGNFIDRVRSPDGVVDFIDVGTGDWRFWTFNVADMAVSVGAALLVLILWRQDAVHAARAASAERATPHDPAA